MRATGNALLS